MLLFTSKEAKDKSIFLDCLTKIISYDIQEIFFSQRSIQKELINDTHPMFRLLFVVEGEYNYKILRNNEVVNITLSPSKALFITQGGVGIVTEYHKNVSCETLQMIFFPQYIRYLFGKQTQDSEELQISWYHSGYGVSQAGTHILKALDELVHVTGSSVKNNLLIKALLHICRENLVEDNPLALSKSFRTYQNIKAYLSEYAYRDINRESVAKTFKLNPSHVSKLFGDYDEYNFNNALKTLRLERAVELLNDTVLSVDEIAMQCGFANTCYFIKVFKLAYGCTPGTFRQSN
jgi:AraC-like DNA-binding protein